MVTAYKAAQDVPEHKDDKDEVPAKGVAGLKNSHNLFYAPRATIIAIDYNSDIEEQLAYKKAPIDSNWD